MRESEMIKVDGKPIPMPSTFDWGLNDVSASDSGRAQGEAKMYKKRIAQKRTISLQWVAVTREDAYIILNAFNPEYFMVEYYDPMDGKNVPREFYCGDRTAPVKIWTQNNKRYTNITFNIIER